ncbi:MAG TPA: hypothetical protein VHL59_17035, partial [Thermoanaerobaculia bacterium]|nr:hypothetical protein [Thermoanaerobaculia bacterium]
MRGFRAVLSLLLLMLAVPLLADSIQPSLIFQSLDQSIWGPGATAAPSEQRFTLIDPNVVRWNAQSPGYPNYEGGFWEQDTYLFGVAEFGGGGRARSAGHAGLWLDLKIHDPGSVDVTYPVTPVVTFPDANSFRAGDTVAVKTSYSLDDGWQMATVSPQFELGIDATVAFSAEVKTKLCIFDCFEANLVPSFAFDTGEFNILTVRPGDVWESPPWMSHFSPLSGSIGVPNISTTGVRSGDRSLAGHGTDQFLTLSLDLTAIATDVANMMKIPIPPLSRSTSEYPGLEEYGGVRAHYNIVTVNAVARLTARQNFRFDPNLRAVFVFGQPLEHWIVSGGNVGPQMTAGSVEVAVGDTLYVRYPEQDKQPTAINSTFRLDNQFTSETGLSVAETIETEAASFGVKLPSVEIFPELCTPEVEVAGETIVPEICTPSVSTDDVNISIGPMFEHVLPIASQDLGNVFAGSWQLQGFAPVTVEAFALDPENPIVNVDQQTGAVRNLGAGRRQVAYAIDISNGGDVKLSDVHLKTDLANAFGAAHSFAVDQVIGCELATNPDFDGVANQELLAPGTALEVGAAGRVVLVVSVYPKPDPSPYVSTANADGTSQLGTLVTKSDSSDVLLGPGVIDGIDDYVLFADHIVKLDSIGNSFGHIGANDFIEVKNGTSGIVAGDLRARRTIKVQGDIMADYAYAGGSVDVVRPAKLTLTGNAKPGSSLPSYSVPATPFNPPAAFNGNVWVEDNGSRALAPGYYGDVTVNRGALLTLAPGVYHFLSLHALDSARVQMSSSVDLNVRKLALGANALLAIENATSRNATINVTDAGEIHVGAGAWIRGTLNAPRANVTLGERSQLEGSA